MRYSILKPGSQRFSNKPIYGFDVETYSDKNKFYMCSIWNDKEKYRRFFYDPDEFIDHIKQKRFKDSVIGCTNLGFDFFSVFFDHEDVNSFETLFRGSDLLYAKTYIKNNEFQRKNSKNAKRLIFLDTLNYAGLSVEKLGKLLNIEKMEKPPFLGHKPKTMAQKDYLEQYNMRDSEISAKALKFFFESFKQLGASNRLTIASTAMSLFRNNYLDKSYFRHKFEDLDNQFKAYYGGRTEAFCRGRIENLNYYDVNSLYPFVMSKFEYPDPNSMRHTRKQDIELIHAYHGISEVDILSPEDRVYPLLPLRHEKKLIFPVGNFRGWYSHVELRKALELGYIIKKIHETYYFLETVEPFKRYVHDLYNMRKELKNKGSSMEYVIKLLLNSLYGKFGQKFRDRDNWVPIPDSFEEFQKLDVFERIGKYVRIKKDFTEPATFCIPIWALYVTAYARLHLHNLIERSHPYYVDTDSIMTTKKMATGEELGELKLEMNIYDGTIVKPKMYAIRGDKGDHVKVKGLGRKLVFKDFNKLLIDNKISYTKFAKFKESLRRGFEPNEIFTMSKTFDLEDNKRVWKEKFNFLDLQSSQPLLIEQGLKGIHSLCKRPLQCDMLEQDLR